MIAKKNGYDGLKDVRFNIKGGRMKIAENGIVVMSDKA